MTSIRRAIACAVLGMPFTVLGCGGADAPRKDGGTTDAAAASSSEPKPEDTGSGAPAGEDAERAKGTKNIMKALATPDMDREQSGRVAAQGISEVGYGLPPAQLKGLAAVVSEGIDPSQCSVILMKTLEESAKPLVDKRCTSFASLAKKVSSMPPAAQVRELISTCKIDDVGEKDVENLNPWAVLVSETVMDELSADPKSNADERKIARAVVNVCRRTKA